MSTQSPTPFNWRDYIHLHESLGKDKPAVERVLDNIAATGEDGQNLIKLAYSSLTDKTLAFRDNFLNADREESRKLGIKQRDMATKGIKKIEIRGDGKAQAETLGIENKGSHVNALIPGLVTLDMEQARRLVVDTPKGFARLSLTGFVVHELYHSADIHLRPDIKASPEKQKELLDKLVPSTTLTFTQKRAVLRAYYEKLNEEATAYQKSHPHSNPEKNAMGIAVAMGAAHTKLAANEAATIADIAKRAGVPSANFSLALFKNPEALVEEQAAVLARAEEQATRYTDVFMTKHFAGEPWRDVYRNAKKTEAAGDIIIRRPNCGTIETGVYAPESITLESLGTLQQPSISTTPSPFCGKGQTPKRPDRPPRLV
jgi:hypothetical protein